MPLEAPVPSVAQMLLQPDSQTLNAQDDQGLAAENGMAAFDVLANDADLAAADSLHLSDADIISGHGTVHVADGQLQYDPGAAYDHLADGEQAKVVVRYGIVNDAGEIDSATLDLTIIGGNDAPTVAQTLTDQTALEDAALNFVIPADTFNDVDASDVLTYSAALKDGSPLPDWLSFDPNTRAFSGTPDNSDVGVLQVTVTATDSQGIEASDSFDLTIGNLNDAPDELVLDGGSVVENAAAGTVVGTAAGHDVDAGDSLSYALIDDAEGRFAIDNTTGTITVADGAGLDFENVSSHDLRIRVTDQSGASYDETFTIGVIDTAETLNGTHVNDTLSGGAGADVISGLGGADIIDGGAGTDTISGGRGKDRLIGAEGDDFLDGGSSHDTLFGGDGDDTLLGGSASGGGKNTEIGGDDTLYGEDGDDTLIGGDGADTLYGGADDDVLDGGTGNDRLNGGVGDDILSGGVGADIIDGGSGSDQVSYEQSNQAIRIDLGANMASGGHAEGDVINNIEQVVGSTFDDVLIGDHEDNTLSGGAGNDQIDAGQGDDTVIGGDGDDVIIGGQGDDMLIGGAGNDILDGGDGADHFLLMMAQGNDIVSGGDGGWVDMIELQDGSGGSNLGEFGADWTVVIDSGAIENAGSSAGPNDEPHGWLELAEDSSGTIMMQDGTEITFDGVEHIMW
ncbi:MAG: putative Ig domain-containing protein [Geminicoccaceae bacterium]